MHPSEARYLAEPDREAVLIEPYATAGMFSALSPGGFDRKPTARTAGPRRAYRPMLRIECERVELLKFKELEDWLCDRRRHDLGEKTAVSGYGCVRQTITLALLTTERVHQVRPEKHNASTVALQLHHRDLNPLFSRMALDLNVEIGGLERPGAVIGFNFHHV